MRHRAFAAVVALTMACGASDSATGPAKSSTPRPTNPPASACPGYADPAHCPPFQTGGPYSVSGTLTLRAENGVGPFANARVGGFVFMPNGAGYSMGYAASDSAGHYRFTQVPKGFVVLFAALDQPCAATVMVSGDATRDVEVVTGGAQHPPTPGETPVISGVVYRQTPTGRQVVPGARIELEYFMDLVTATTMTDASGRYRLCQLPTGPGQTIFVTVAGSIAKEMVIDI